MAIKLDDVAFMEAIANERPNDNTEEYETQYLQLSPGPLRGFIQTVRTTDSPFAEAADLYDEALSLQRERTILNASYQHYGARVRIRGRSPTDRTCFWLLLPSSKPVQWRSALLPPGSLIELPPSSELDLVAEGIDVVTFSLSNRVRDSILRCTGHRSTVGATPLRTELAARLSRTIRAYLRQVRFGGDATDLEMRVGHELSSCLASEPERAIPRVSSERRRRATRRAEAYLHDHLDRSIPAHDVAEAAGVPLRSLQDGFRREFGVAPHAFHLRLRLEHAKRRLETGSVNSTRVTDVALAFGFTHFGRFAVNYKRHFGESPVETLRRGPSAILRATRLPPRSGPFLGLAQSG